MSAEPGRKTAYSNDLQWRIVYQRIAMNLPLTQIMSYLHFVATIFSELVGWKPKMAFIFPVAKVLNSTLVQVLGLKKDQVRSHQTFQFPFGRLSPVNPKLIPELINL